MGSGTLQSLQRDFFSGQTGRRGSRSGREHWAGVCIVSTCTSWNPGGKTHVGAAVVVDRGLGHHRVAGRC